jgi:hypothetical protein
MAASIGCPATRVWPGHAALRLAGAPGLRGADARPPVTMAGPLRTG